MDKNSICKVIISNRCRNMLASHIQFLTIKSPAAALQVKEKLIEALESLECMPERYPFLDTDFIPPNKYHRMFVQKWYLVLYQIKDRNVFVDYIIDCRQDYGWLIH